MREAARLEVAEGGGTREPTIGNNRTVYVDQSNLRPEARHEDPSHSGRTELVTTAPNQLDPAPASRPDGHESTREDAPTPAREPARAGGPAKQRRSSTWTEPDVAERPASYAIYRPETGSTTRESASPRTRTEAK
jgi:hypothetical protein